MEHTATYSPEDNKLRLYPACRLDKDEYNRVKSAGFKWAPKQELFVAPMWTPEREDLLIEMCGEVGDEDTSLVDRAEQRAERFEDYSDKRAQDADRARAAVSAIADNIPFGQPILVGHHSEKHARKDAAKIENGMRKAVQMWKTSGYWTSRAAGALHHAKYKELPAVRYRRIKGLEADKRKQEKYKQGSEDAIRIWGQIANEQDKEKQLKMAIHYSGMADCRLVMPRKEGDRPDWDQRAGAWETLTNHYPSLYAPRTIDEVLAVALSPNTYPRSIARYERWIDHYENRLAYERAMLDESGGIATETTGPQVGGACKCWASHHGGFSYIVKVNKITVSVLDNWGNDRDHDGTRNFKRNIEFDKISAVMTKAEVDAARADGRLVEYQDKTGFALLDTPQPKRKPEAKPEREGLAAHIEQIKASLANGVKVVTAPQLFPTPTEIAARMVEIAGIEPGNRVLEPSAGTGNILRALPCMRPGGEAVAVEISSSLLYLLEPHADNIVCGDFLEQNGDLGKFDAVLMNPPFANGADVKHIKHALNFLKPGGRLVAICANGPRQNEQLRPIVEEHGGFWEELPAGTFKDQGTNVNTVLLSLTMHEEEPADFGLVTDALEICEDLGIAHALQGSLFAEAR